MEVLIAVSSGAAVCGVAMWLDPVHRVRPASGVALWLDCTHS